MVKSCFCLCLNSILGFHILCFPFHIWLFACCLCSPNVFRCAEVAFLPYRLLPERFCSDQCMATAAPGSQQVMQHCSHHQQLDQTRISLPEQGVLQRPVLAVHNHSNRNIDVTLGCVFSLSAHPRRARGWEALRSKQAQWQADSGGCFPSPGGGDLGAVRIYCTCSVPQCCDRQHVMSLACFVMILIQDRMPFPPVSNWEAGASFTCSASLSFLYSCFFLLRCIDFCVFNHSRHISLPIRFS